MATVNAADGGGLFGFVEGSHARAVAALLLLCLLLFVPGFSGLPPMDRDEPRFAQATRQMLETGDFVDIRFQAEARHKKPVGIYWLQAAAVTAAEALGLPDARGTIWLYRLPSLLGAILAVMFTYAAGVSLTTRRAAFLAASLVAATILLGVEARLAKTDAVVAATVAVAMAALARVWLARDDAAYRLPAPWAAAFWIAIGVGILVKGPITPAVPLLAAIVLGARERTFGWLLRLRPGWGLPLVLLIVLPWFVAIMVKSGGAFLGESVGQDMLGKVSSGQESHGAPPGTYLAAFLATAWPMAPFVLLAIPFAWNARRDDAVSFLLAWAIPMWIVFELVPTKLPHYVLPLYPALALLALVAAERGKTSLQGIVPRIVMGLLPLLAFGLLVAAGVVAWHFEHWLPLAALAFLAAAAAIALLAWRLAFSGRLGSSVMAAVVASALVCIGAFGELVPGLRSIGVSPRLVAAARAAGCDIQGVATVGFREPSLVFLTRTDLAMPDARDAAAFVKDGPCRVAFVESRDEQAFLDSARGSGISPRLLSRVDGININGGRKLDIGVYVGQ
jgi:4-amino-4-deoxy-L-arabinose transferase-like glycosyltransferase